MPYTAFVNDEGPFIEVKYTGQVTRSELDKAMAEQYRLTEEHGIKLYLIDCTETVSLPGVFDLYYFASAVEKQFVQKISKIAMILPKDKENIDSISFYETTAQNRGIHVRLFKTRQEAVHFLNSPESG